MAKLPYRSLDDVEPGDRPLLARPINLYRLMIHSPGALRAVQTFGRFIRFDSTLDPRLRELAILQVGYLTRSDYEWSHHIHLGLDDFGLSADDVTAVIDESEGRPSSLGLLEQTVLRLAREMTDGVHPAPETFEQVRAVLSEEHLVDLVSTIAFYNCVVRVLGAFEVDVEPEFADVLSRFPLPGLDRA